VVAALGACGEARLSSSGQCVFGDEHHAATAPDGVFDGVDLVLAGETALVAWSHREGLFVRVLDTEGRPAGEVKRIGARCDGGVDAAASASGWIVACLARAVPSKDHAGRVVLAWLDPTLGVRARSAVGSAGSYSRGVDVVADRDRAIVVWHDGTPGDHRVWLARVAPGETDVEPRLVSRPGLAAGAATVALYRSRVIVAWGETWFDDGGYLVGQVLVSDLRGAPREMAVIIHDDPRPVLGQDDDGLLLAYRDEQPAGTRARLFLRRVSDELETLGEPVMVGRADGAGRAAVLPCQGAITTVAPHSYGRWEVLVGLNRLDGALGRIGIERQMYEHGADFSQSAATCAGDHLLVLTAERGSTTRPTAALSTTRVDCS